MTLRDSQQQVRQARGFRRLAAVSAVTVVAGGLMWSGGSPATAAASCFQQTVTIEATADGQTLVGTEGADVISIGAFSDIVVDASGGDDRICSRATGGRGARIDAGAGGDQVDVSGDAQVQGGAGDDTLSGGGRSDDPDPTKPFTGTLVGGQGDDEIDVLGGHGEGGDGADVLIAYESGDLDGGAGADRLRMAPNLEDPFLSPYDSGPFLLRGGKGDDRIELMTAGGQGGPVTNCLIPSCWSSAEGGPGTDTLSLAATAGHGAVDLAAGTVSYAGGSGRAVSIENVVGSPGADVIRGSGRVNRLDGRGGNDRLYGLGRKDVLIGGKGRDAAYGGPGNDRCVAELRYSC